MEAQLVTESSEKAIAVTLSLTRFPQLSRWIRSLPVRRRHVNVTSRLERILRGETMAAMDTEWTDGSQPADTRPYKFRVYQDTPRLYEFVRSLRQNDWPMSLLSWMLVSGSLPGGKSAELSPKSELKDDARPDAELTSSERCAFEEGSEQSGNVLQRPALEMSEGEPTPSDTERTKHLVSDHAVPVDNPEPVQSAAQSSGVIPPWQRESIQESSAPSDPPVTREVKKQPLSSSIFPIDTIRSFFHGEED